MYVLHLLYNSNKAKKAGRFSRLNIKLVKRNLRTRPCFNKSATFFGVGIFFEVGYKLLC